MRRLLIDLRGGATALIDESDLELVAGKTLYLGTNGYVYYSIWKDGRSTPYTLHSLIAGPVPGMHIDHINGVKTDNRRANLRIVTPQLNQVNRRNLNRNNTSGVRGVAYTALSKAKPWRAQIMVNRKNIHLGLFATKEEAVAARKAAEDDHYGVACPDV
jgi:hypothetical protein